MNRARHVRYKFQIPDARRPYSLDERGPCGPSGHLIPFRPKKVTSAQVRGRRVDELRCNVGTYGMGGPGFFGLRLGHEWLVVAIWGAAEWILVNGRLIADDFARENKRPRPWITEKADRLSPRAIGETIASVKIGRQTLSMVLSGNLEFRIDKGPENRPVLEGSRELRRFASRDDLRRAVFLAPTTEIWV